MEQQQISKSSNDSAPEWEKNYRISQSTQPLHYDVYLFPDLESDTFSGKVAIDIQVTGPPRTYLAVHTKFLTITKVPVFASIKGNIFC